MTMFSATKTLLRKSVLAISLVALSACSTFTSSSVSISSVGDNPAPTVAPPDGASDDVSIGRREHPRIVAAYGGIYSDRAAEIMIAQIVGRLMSAANQPDTQFTITILDSAEVNAFALPGGYIYVTRGILALASDKSEIAAVLAHEMAHIILRHARARTNRTRTTEIVERVISGVLGQDAATEDANRARSLAAFSQNQELEADREGIKIAGKAGFDPYAAARFLGVMGRFAKFSSGGQTGNDFLSSHPSTPDRIQKAVQTATSLFGAEGVGDTDRPGYMASIAGLTFGDSPTQGSIVGRRFINPGNKFTFNVPQGYTLQNSQSAVVGVAGDGEAVRFDSADVPATLALGDYLKSGWIAGLKPETVTAQSYNGIEMASGVAQTEQWFFRVSVMRFDGEVYRFIFAAKADSARFAAGADATLKSFRRADAADLGQIRKVGVKVVTAKASDTADTLARQMAGLTRGTELFYIINDLFPGDPVIAGTQYKIVSLQ